MKLPILVTSALSLIATNAAVAQAKPQKNLEFRRIVAMHDSLIKAQKAAEIIPPLDSAMTVVRDVDEIIASLDMPELATTPINKAMAPWVFIGYRHLKKKEMDTKLPVWVPGTKVLTNDSIDNETSDIRYDDSYIISSILDMPEDEVSESDSIDIANIGEPTPDYSLLTGDPTPKWMRNTLNLYRIQEDFMYDLMVTEPEHIEYSYWGLPVPPRLREDDVTFAGYIKRLELPEVDTEKAILPEEVLRRKHWLHNFGSSLHFSQAFISKNWYQGGNNHLSLLFNIYWNVQLNQVYHPNLLLQSALSYKIGLNSTPQDEVHAYSISEDILQYNLNSGLKAFQKWFYSLNLQFKTQILRNYENNSMKRKSSFLSPGDFNLGLGMAYSHQNKKKTLQLTATISPLSYNLKTCISDKIDHGQFNIEPDRKTRSDIGSNGEFNMTWQVTHNINYRTRVFLFTDYDYFLADWENTVNFSINKFLSTQIYMHLRHDTSSDMSTSWKHFMMREVLSFGLTYTFSSKP